MAKIKNKNTNEVVYLKNHHVFGRRSENADTSLLSPDASKLHASVTWSNGWVIRDFSRNGTWLDDRKIPPGISTDINIGQLIRFSVDAIDCWEVLDISEPRSMLIPLQNQENAIELGEYNLLPDQHDPLVAIFKSCKANEWRIQSINEADSAVSLVHDQLIKIGAGVWRVFLANAGSETIENLAIDELASELECTFKVSLDEENVQVIFNDGNIKVDLEPMVHNELLLYLARARIQCPYHLSEEDAGWVSNELLAQHTGFDQQYLSLLIFRARKHIAQVSENATLANQVVERRRGSTRFGFPIRNIKIYKAGQFEESLQAEPAVASE